MADGKMSCCSKEKGTANTKMSCCSKEKSTTGSSEKQQ
jgi:hypothetical protein